MSKCENCIHEKACKQLCDVHKLAFGSARFCDHYKDKSLCVELPCKVGDEVYLVNKENGLIGNGTEFIVTGYEIYSDSENIYRACCELNKTLIPMTFGGKNIGKTVFLTKEDAQRKLKEIEGK